MQLLSSKYVSAIKISPEAGGTIEEYFFSDSGKIDFVTSFVQKNKKIYLASLKSNKIIVVDYL